MKALTLCFFPDDCIDEMRIWVTDCRRCVASIAFCVDLRRCSAWARRSETNDAEDPVSRALTTPCGLTCH